MRVPKCKYAIVHDSKKWFIIVERTVTGTYRVSAGVTMEGVKRSLLMDTPSKDVTNILLNEEQVQAIDADIIAESNNYEDLKYQVPHLCI